ncbi:phospholipase D-like domain-containing protein [Phenylobacterium sp.]|jgi:cardiolipin synthase|uniref:phospholipase D-like domain-containing protein n=1 Tax=Phenylobacterium sp. TaxID=1871053 RepID=UPI002E378A76|nr:phospholipase D-like domain-containing protein [Phenylobacterium sp.]HEX3365659.1 phospholipase D-like domain-containing protein [Phenylobacterium sp.]
MAALCIGFAGLSACTTVPTISPTVGRAASAQTPEIIGTHGPLTSAQIKAKLAQLSDTPGEDALLHRHMAIEQAVAESPLVAGETTHLLKDGVITFRAMFAAIGAAKHSVNLEYFIFEDVEIDGVHLGDLLLAKRAEGVAVNVIYDSFGSSDTPKAFLDRLRAGGVNVLEFNPLNPLKAKVGYTPNDRDHRKILVVDGSTAIVGGVNLSTTYQPNPMGKSGSIPGEPAAHWRDTDLEITGPAVAQLQTLFQDHWREQHGPAIDEAGWFPTLPPTGGAVVRILGSAPHQDATRYYMTVISAIRSARKSVTASAAYFVPTHDEMEALTEAARRGVDVRLLLPDRSDSPNSIALGHAHYADLLEAGVKIYETHDLVLHSKTVVVDGVWSAVGSSNFDHRSIISNDEVDAVVLGADTARELEAMAEDDRARATPIDGKTWSHRPLSARARETYARVWERWL